MSLSELGRDDDAPRRDWLFNLHRDIDAQDHREAQNAETVADALWEQFVYENGTKSRIQAAADALVATGVVPKRVIIEVDGGVARVAYVSPGVEVQIIDHDEDGPPVIEPAPAWCAHGVHYDRPCERCAS